MNYSLLQTDSHAQTNNSDTLRAPCTLSHQNKHGGREHPGSYSKTFAQWKPETVWEGAKKGVNPKNEAKYFVSLRYRVCKLSIVAVLHFENMLSPVVTNISPECIELCLGGWHCRRIFWATFACGVSKVSLLVVMWLAEPSAEPWDSLNLPGFFSFYRLCPFDAGLVRLWLYIQRCCMQKEQKHLCLIPFKSAMPQSLQVIVLR